MKKTKDGKKMNENCEKEEVKNFQCLRCGRCCQVYEVHGVPGYEDRLKLKGILCKRCEPAEINQQGQWYVAFCRIHETADYPEECGKFKKSASESCSIGLSVWRERKEKYPKSELPKDVLKHLSRKKGK